MAWGSGTSWGTFSWGATEPDTEELEVVASDERDTYKFVMVEFS